MRIYVAGASAERQFTVKPYMDQLILDGWVITHDWVKQVDEAERLGTQMDPVRMETNAGWDLEGVRSADVVWIVCPLMSKVSTGCWVELGYALAYAETQGLHVVVSGIHHATCIFTMKASKRFNRHVDAMAYLKQYRRDQSSSNFAHHLELEDD